LELFVYGDFVDNSNKCCVSKFLHTVIRLNSKWLQDTSSIVIHVAVRKVV
jgi:hypothetical protein